MFPGSRRFLFRVAVLVLCWLAATGVAVADDRSTELFRYLCSNDLGRRDVTLFANGTVRLRQGLWKEQELYLDELLREELRDYIGQLRDIQVGADSLQTQLPGSAPQGDWVEDCEIVLALPGFESETWEFSTLQVTPLVVSRLIQVAEELADYTKILVASQRLSPDYQPHRGDVLRNSDGKRYRVIALTTDGLAVELEGLDSPIRMFVSLADLSSSFEALEEQTHR